MYNLDEEKIDMHWATGIYGSWQGTKAENVIFYFSRRDSRHLFVSDSWYCQIQTTIINLGFEAHFYNSNGRKCNVLSYIYLLKHTKQLAWIII